MKLAGAEKHVLGHSGLDEQKDFEIRNSAHAFRILSSGLYSDKVRAVLREIGCNAYDAHVAQGNTNKPFEIKLPNQLDPQFYIRDHGPGLSHAEVMKLYTTYFASTKQNSNDFTGAFGLGSKSPFSYTDAFTITSCHDSKRRIYTAHIGDKGVPVIALMGEADVEGTWEHGLEIGFPVKPEDFREFATKAQSVFCTFKTLPKVRGGSAIKPIAITKDFGEYAFYDADDYGRAALQVIMGNVMYPLDTSKVKHPVDKKEPFLDAGLAMQGVLLRFDIGELQVAASREELQYDTGTQEAIRKRLHKAVKDVLDELKDEFEAVSTWADMCKFRETRKVVERGIHLNADLLKAAGINKKVADIFSSTVFSLPRVDDTLAHYCIMERNFGSVRSQITTNRPTSATGKDWITYDPNISIVTGVAPHAYARVKKALIDGTLAGKVICIVPRKPGEEEPVNDMVEEFRKAMPGITEIPIETLDRPEQMKKRYKKGALRPMPQLTVIVNGNTQDITLVPSDAQVYLPVQTARSDYGRRYFIRPDFDIRWYAMDRLWGHVSCIKKHIKDFDIKHPVEIRKGDLKRCQFEMRNDWIHFTRHVESQLLNQKFLDKLAEIVDGHKPIVPLLTEQNRESPFESMVVMKQYQPNLFQAVEPILQKAGVMDEINRVHKRSWSKRDKYERTDVEPEALTAYKEIADSLDIKVQTPEFKKATLSLDGKFNNVGIDYNTMVTLGKASKNALVNLVQDMII